VHPEKTALSLSAIFELIFLASRETLNGEDIGGWPTVDLDFSRTQF